MNIPDEQVPDTLKDKLHKRLVELSSSYYGYLTANAKQDSEIWQAMWEQTESEVDAHTSQVVSSVLSDLINYKGGDLFRDDVTVKELLDALRITVEHTA
ncbi:hypothetical protein AB0280_17740 [Pseudarthrobacter sp902506025]|uniref:hypothetical protein n=1 Tax=Pseudarthrobacter sp. 902506025 TaxID=3155291 RepID=UPI003450A31C